MGIIIEFLPRESGAFSPEVIEAMSSALENVCAALNLDSGAPAREIMAVRIIELARRGESNAAKLATRVLAEANGLAAPP